MPRRTPHPSNRQFPQPRGVFPQKHDSGRRSRRRSSRENANRSDRIFPFLGLVGVVPHLGNIQVAILIKRSRDRTDDERFRRHEFDMKLRNGFE